MIFYKQQRSFGKVHFLRLVPKKILPTPANVREVGGNVKKTGLRAAVAVERACALRVLAYARPGLPTQAHAGPRRPTQAHAPPRFPRSPTLSSARPADGSSMWEEPLVVSLTSCSPVGAGTSKTARLHYMLRSPLWCARMSSEKFCKGTST